MCLRKAAFLPRFQLRRSVWCAPSQISSCLTSSAISTQGPKLRCPRCARPSFIGRSLVIGSEKAKCCMCSKANYKKLQNQGMGRAFAVADQLVGPFKLFARSFRHAFVRLGWSPKALATLRRGTRAGATASLENLGRGTGAGGQDQGPPPRPRRSLSGGRRGLEAQCFVRCVTSEQRLPATRRIRGRPCEGRARRNLKVVRCRKG